MDSVEVKSEKVDANGIERTCEGRARNRFTGHKLVDCEAERELNGLPAKVHERPKLVPPAAENEAWA